MEDAFSSVLNALPALVWTALPDGQIEFVNRRFCEYAGLSLTEASGNGWQTAIHPEDLPNVVEQWRSILASGETSEMEARLRRFDGEHRWFLISINPMRDEAGQIVKWFGVCTDIDERRQAEEALHRRELDFRLIVDSIPMPVAVTTPTGEVEALNQPTLDYFGKTFEELKGWKSAEVVHPDDLQNTIGAQMEAHQKGHPYNVESRHRRADGTYRWFNVLGLPLRDSEGNILRWFILQVDIDDRKRVEEALQSVERNLNQIINTIPTHIYVLNTQGSVQYVNQAVMDYTGLSLEDVQQEDYRDRVIHPEDFERVRAPRAAGLRRGSPFSTEQRVLGNDGQYRWFLVRYKPLLDEQGRIVRWYVAAFDIEDRKLAKAEIEQAYLRLAEAQRVSQTGSFITDLLLDEHNWSEELCRIFELNPGTRVTTEAIRALFHPEDLPVYEDAFKRAVDGLDRDIDITYRIITPAGNVKHLHAVAHVLEKIAGRPVFIGAIQDVTESKVAEQALTRAREELAHMARVTTLSALTASISHEVNQPLSGIITNASTCLRMLAADPPNIDGARETTQRTIRDGHRAADVITRLRALFTKKEITFEAVDLNEAAREVTALSLGDLQRNRVVLRPELADDLPLVAGDRVQLQQVILNLVRNASDAMSTVDDRPRHLLIKTEPDEDEKVRLSVQDAGVGFDPEVMTKLFDAFYTTKNDGMGIGLSVCRSIIASHQGRIWATLNEGPGATFAFSVPRAASV